MLYVLGWIADSLQQQLSSSAEEDAADRQRDEPRPSEGGGQRIHSRLAAQDHQHERYAYDITSPLLLLLLLVIPSSRLTLQMPCVRFI